MKAYGESIRTVTRNIDLTENDVDEAVTINTETGEVVEPL